MMNKYEAFALGHYLSGWNEEASFGENIEALKHGDCENSECDICLLKDDISVWEPFEDHDEDWIAQKIVSMHEDLVLTFPRELV